MNESLHDLFSLLHQRQVSYILLTDFESEFESRDIDLFVPFNSKNVFDAVLFQLGWYRRKEPAHHTNHFFYHSLESDLYLDVKFALNFANGVDTCHTYLLAEDALQSAVPNAHGLYRPTGFHAVMLYAAHMAYRERGELADKHQLNLKLYIRRYSAETKKHHYAVLADLEKWLSQDFPNNLRELRSIISPYFRCSRQKMIRSKKFHRYGFGIKVLFLGTDGAGKTTLIKAVADKINLKTNNLYLGTGENGWSSEASKTLYRHKFKLRFADKLFSAIKAFVLLPAELCLRTLPAKLKSKYAVTLIDRFPGAVFTDPRKRAVYNFILPKPDLVFFLYASPSELVKRKPSEITVAHSEADIAKFKQVAEIVSQGQFISIDTTDVAIDEARDRILTEIYRHSRVRTHLLTPVLTA